jgi:predicted N-acetyltransferase YhbS
MLRIIKETKEYYNQAEECIQKAFWNVYMPGCEEHYLVYKMRSSPEYVSNLSFLALDDGHVVGAIYGSVAKYNSDDIITFGPLGVDPKYQRQGIGGMLIQKFIKETKKMGYKAIVITGVPEYYPRFGFQDCYKLGITMEDGIQFPALMGLELEKGYFDNNPGVFREASVFFSLDRNEVEKYNSFFPPLEKKVLPDQRKK